jgi:hypothetical protein
MIQAYIASHGATIRQLKKTEWPESSRIAQVLLGKSSIVDATDQFNTMIRETEHDIKFKLIDHARPDIWPTQSVLSAAKFQIQSAELEKEMAESHPKLAGWFASMNRRGAGSFLRVIPSRHEYQVGPDLFRIQISMRILAPIPSLVGRTCICGHKGPDVDSGIHFVSQCNKVTMNGTRHNAVATCLSKILEKSGWHVRPGENANWFRYNKHMRPFDVVARPDPMQQWIGIDIGVADPTAHSQLPSGHTYFKSGKSSAQLAHNKKEWLFSSKRKWGGLKEQMDAKQLTVEATGGWGTNFLKFVKPVFEEAKDIELDKGLWTWSAQTFSAYWAQQISFAISKFTAVAILNGSRAIAKAQAATCSD